MPETAIGFFPDIGASYFLNKCPGYLGYYLGLTGVHLGPADSLLAGFATHYVPRENHGALLYALEKAPQLNGPSVDDLVASLSAAPPEASLTPYLSLIDTCFSKPTVEEIITALYAYEGDAFAAQTIQTLRTRAPLSLKITLEQLQRGRGQDLDFCLNQEFHLSQNFLKNPNFQEGIRAALIDKDKKPQWSPSCLDAVTSQMIDSYFHTHGRPDLLRHWPWDAKN